MPHHHGEMTEVAAELSLDQARRLALRAQGLIGPPPGGRRDVRVSSLLRRLGAIQLDTISVLARSHELVPYARLGPVGRVAVEKAFWSRPARAVEYWAHAACVLPLESWPFFAHRRRRSRDRYLTEDHRAQRDEVLARLAGLGPVSTEQLGGAKNGGAWWDWSPLKRAAEELLAAGEIVCTERRGWRRVYDLAERAIPAELLGDDLDDLACATHLVAAAGRHLGVATEGDLAEYFRLRLDEVRTGIVASGLVPVRVEGWTQPAWADPQALVALDAEPARERCRTTLLSPFDSLIWDRKRTLRLFDFTHRIEAYVPAAARVHGYFAMPLLANARLAGRVDPRRAGNTLVAIRTSLPRGAVRPMARALVDTAEWVGCTAVAVETVTPPELREPLQTEINRLS
jgi:uncharacterized protein YcaQ